MNDQQENKYRSLGLKDRKTGTNELNEHMHREYNRIKSILRRLTTPEERWDYMCDNTPMSALGCTMCDGLLQWGKNEKIEIKRGDLGRSNWTGAIKQHGDRLIQRSILPTEHKVGKGIASF